MIKVINKKDGSESTFESIDEAIKFAGFESIEKNAKTRLETAKEFSYLNFILIAE